MLGWVSGYWEDCGEGRCSLAGTSTILLPHHRKVSSEAPATGQSLSKKPSGNPASGELRSSCLLTSMTWGCFPHSRHFVNIWEEAGEILFCPFGNVVYAVFISSADWPKQLNLSNGSWGKPKCYIYGKAAFRFWHAFQVRCGHKLRVCQHFHYENCFVVS